MCKFKHEINSTMIRCSSCLSPFHTECITVFDNWKCRMCRLMPYAMVVLTKEVKVLCHTVTELTEHNLDLKRQLNTTSTEITKDNQRKRYPDSN